MTIKNVSRQPLCVQGQTRGIHLMPGEVREVEEGELATGQMVNLIKLGLLQVRTNSELPMPNEKKSKSAQSRNSSLLISNSTDQREVANG